MTFPAGLSGLLALIGLLVMTIGYVRQRRRVERLRRWAGSAPERARPRALEQAAMSRSLKVALVAAATVAVAAYIGLAYVFVTTAGDHPGQPRAVTTANLGRPIDDLRDLSRQQRHRIPVAVLNGSSIPGLAEKTAQRLATLGFGQGPVANAPLPHRAAPTVAYADGDAAGPALAIARLLHVGHPTQAAQEVRAVAQRAEVIVTVGS